MYLRSISILCNSISLINFNIFACYNFYLFISKIYVENRFLINIYQYILFKKEGVSWILISKEKSNTK